MAGKTTWIYYDRNGKAIKTERDKQRQHETRRDQIFKSLIPSDKVEELEKSNEGYKSRYIRRVMEEYEEHHTESVSRYGMLRYAQSAPSSATCRQRQSRQSSRSANAATSGEKLFMSVLENLEGLDEEEFDFVKMYPPTRPGSKQSLVGSTSRKISSVSQVENMSTRRSSVQFQVEPGSRKGSVSAGPPTTRSLQLWSLLAKKRRSSTASARRRRRHHHKSDDGDEVTDYNGDDSSRRKEGSFLRNETSIRPLVRFRRAAKLIHIILVAISSTRRENKRQEAKLMSFSQLQDELNQRTVYGDDLEFDPAYYRACKELQISHEAKTNMSMDPRDRSEEQLHTALVSLNTACEAFGEFPIKMQQSLVRRGWYEHFEAKRVIIRQGHYADNFYFILSGTAVVTILTTNPKTGESFQNTVAFLKKGNSFGELALMYGGTRNATVTCKDDVELLAVGREDFVDIFMHVDRDVEPEHIQFLRTVDLLNGWPTDCLPYEDPKTCLFTYFRRGVIMCRDSNTAEWIYIIKTGSCRVLKALEPVKAEVALSSSVPDLRSSSGSLASSPRHKRMKHSKTSSYLPLPRNGILTQINHNDANVPGHRKLPPLMRQDTENINSSGKDHQKVIDEIFDEKHKGEASQQTAEKKVNFAQTKAKSKPKSNQKIYVQVQKLGPKDTFGLVPVAFNMMHDTMSMILVSDGAECVLINKKFFTQHLTEAHHKGLRQTIQPYPTQDNLQQKLQDQLNWEAFKLTTVQKEILHQTRLQESTL